MQKKIPMRQCAGCRAMRAKKEMIRVVRSPKGTISTDSKGKAPGRGVYLCPDPECLRKAERSGALARSLETAIPPEIYRELEERIGRNEE